MDDEEVTLLHHKRDMDVPDNPGSDIRDGPDTSDAQREHLDLEAAGGTGDRKVEHHGSHAPLLSPERHILFEEKVTTPPRGGRPAPVTQVPPGGARAVPQIFTEVHRRDGGRDRKKDVGWPVDMLVDTVAQGVRAPRQAAFTTTKVARFDGTTSWEQFKQVFDAIVSSNGWDMILRRCSCSLIGSGFIERGSASATITSVI